MNDLVPAYEFDSNGCFLTPEQSATKRQKKGTCVTCSNQLFEIKKNKFNPFQIKKRPLTIAGRVLEGRCLDCNPINNYGNRILKMRGKINEPDWVSVNRSFHPTNRGERITRVVGSIACPKNKDVKDCDAEIGVSNTKKLTDEQLKAQVLSNHTKNQDNDESNQDSRNENELSPVTLRKLASFSNWLGGEFGNLDKGGNKDLNKKKVYPILLEDRISKKINDIFGSPNQKDDNAHGKGVLDNESKNDFDCLSEGENEDPNQNKQGDRISSSIHIYDSSDQNKNTKHEKNVIDDVRGVDFNDVNDVIDAMFLESSNATISKKLCEKLVSLATDKHAKVKITLGGGIMALHQIMSGDFVMDEALQEKASEALNLLLSGADDSLIREFSIVETTTCMMVNFPGSIRIQENALCILKNLAGRSEEYKENIVNSGGIYIVLSMLGNPNSSEKLKNDGRVFLGKLSHYL